MRIRLSPLTLSARRAYASSSSASGDIQAWCERLVARPATYARDTLDTNRSLAMHRTLPTRGQQGLISGASSSSNSSGSAATWRDEPRVGDSLRKAWSLEYWWPRAELDEVSEDGGAKDYNAPPPYTRRMWASGTFTWPSPSLPLLGHTLIERTRVIKAEVKKDMVFVHQERTILEQEDAAADGKEIEGGKELQREVRVHVFRRPADEEQGKVSAPAKKAIYAPPSSPMMTLSYIPTSTLLFRFSALTFNAHRIHYDEPWTRSFEGHPRVVVHGPMSALLLVELAAFHEREGRRLAKFEYRATAPMYVAEEIRLGCKWADGEREMELWATQGGRVGMTGRAVFE